MMDEKVREDRDFKSSVEIEEHAIMLVQDEKRKQIESNKYIKEAEELFRSKVDKIILNEE